MTDMIAAAYEIAAPQVLAKPEAFVKQTLRFRTGGGDSCRIIKHEKPYRRGTQNSFEVIVFSLQQSLCISLTGLVPEYKHNSD
jgi:hypothetical protein